jgi:DNA-binding Lrp family transcriptional regulator
MGILDKLKPTPRWKHADPAVRLEAVRELDDPIELAVLAETDSDARVRRAAIPRTTDPAVLGRVASADADPETRDRAADRLVALATAGGDDASAVTAVAMITDGRRLSAIAKGDASDAVRAEALARTTDARALGSIARHAKHESTAAASLEKLTSRDELIDVAQNADHKDIALGAFERLLQPSVDLALVRAIETRTSQKAVARRARAIIADAEAAEAARLAAEEERHRREAAACDAIEHLTDVSDPDVARAELARLMQAFGALGVTDASLRDRAQAAAARVDAAIAQRDIDIREAAELARLRAESTATREALCERVETLDGDDVLAQLTPIEEEWRSLTLVGDGPEAARLAERFAKAVAACRKRHELGALLAQSRATYASLVSEAEALVSVEDTGAAMARWQSLSREARSHAHTLANALRSDAELDARLDAAGQALTAREAARDAARREAALRARQAVIMQLQRLTERAKRASDADTITLREGDRLMKDIVAGLELAGKAENAREIHDAADALRKLQEQVAPRVRELREMDDWRRFANAQRQEQLIAMAEAIVVSLKAEAEQGKLSDLAATSRALKELHASWQDVAEAPRNVAQRLWDRFRTATDFIRARCEPFFQKMREERGANLDKKNAIVAEAESLAQSTDWGKTTARFQELQKAWQDSGPAPRDAGRDLAMRFRTASTAFFARRREDLTTRKKVWSENQARKEALCARAEALADSTEWDSASSELKRLQNEWKTVGPIRRNKSEELWNRFRASADKFFERYHNRHQINLSNKLAEREALIVELETLAAIEPSARPDDFAARVQQVRTTWNRSVPIPSAEAKVLADRWQATLTRVAQQHADAFAGSDFDPAVARQRMEKLVVKIEALLADVRDDAPGLSPTEALAAKLRSALASNAMGKSGSDEAKWRAAAESVREAQSSWDRLSPIAGADARPLDQRFREACRRVMDQAKRHRPSGGPAPKRGNPPRQFASV